MKMKSFDGLTEQAVKCKSEILMNIYNVVGFTTTTLDDTRLIYSQTRNRLDYWLVHQIEYSLQ